jgi:ribosomal protein S18 acetylase RimI-like enzyme
MAICIRPAVLEDGPAQQRIELLAGQRFLEVDMRGIAGDEAISLEELAVYAREHRAWTAFDETGHAIGYVLVRAVDGNAHIVQVSVVPELQGRGVGRALIDEVGSWARSRRMPAVTLSTFSNVPWNQPLYEHLGFRELRDSDIGPELAAIRARETSIGLDPAIRVCMAKVLTP